MAVDRQPADGRGAAWNDPDLGTRTNAIGFETSHVAVSPIAASQQSGKRAAGITVSSNRSLEGRKAGGVDPHFARKP